MIVREERPEDAPGVRRVLERAFGQADEANLVDRIRQAGAATVSLVAVSGPADGGAGPDDIIGHILFSPVTIGGRPPRAPTVGLAPMAVAPEHQRRGVGAALVEAGLAQCRDGSIGLVVVLGHPDYYPRFGFRPAHLSGLSCEYDAAPEAFMVLELEDGALESSTGVVRYHPAFADL
ncbi:MAG: N-acetyltransferase [Acidobacteria bacterium]|nr:MAG: N-acetyltransferase [Acidobacteriota bacterium]